MNKNYTKKKKKKIPNKDRTGMKINLFPRVKNRDFFYAILTLILYSVAYIICSPLLF